MVSVELEDIIPLQRNCPDTKPFFDYFESGIFSEGPKAARKLVVESEFYEIIDVRMRHIHHPRDKRVNQLKPTIIQLCLSQELRLNVVKCWHDEFQHPSTDRLFALLRQRYFWKTMFCDISEYIRNCEDCAQSKINRKRKPSPMAPMPPPAGPFERWGFDFYGPLRPTIEGYKYLLVCIDHFSRFPELIPLKSTGAEELANALYNSIFTRYGAISSILSDLRSNLTSRVFEALSKIVGFKHLKTSGYHLSCNGIVEKFNQSITTALRLYCTDQDKWLDCIPSLLYSYRAVTASKTTNASPFRCLYGRPMKLPIDVTLTETESFHADTQKYIQDLIPRLALTERVINENTRERQMKNKTIHDRYSAVPKFEVGDKVYLKNCARIVGQNTKLARPNKGPYFIEQAGYKNSWFELRHCETDE